MEVVVLFTVFKIFATALAFDVSVVSDFFVAKEVGSVTAIMCNEYNQRALSKKLSLQNIQNNFLTPKSNLNTILFHSDSKMTGIVLDMKCESSSLILQDASEQGLFDLTRHWLIFANVTFTQEDFGKFSMAAPQISLDIDQYLEDENDNMVEGETLRMFNSDINQHLLNDSKQDVGELEHPTNVHPELQRYLDLKAMVDSEVILAVKSLDDVYNLYEVHRKTQYTPMLIEKVGMFQRDGDILSNKLPERLSTSAVTKRRDFGRAIIRAVAVTEQYTYFSKSDELTSSKFDYLAMKGLQMSKLFEEQFNIRLLIKSFDGTGLMSNEQNTGILSFLARQKTDMTANGLNLLPARLDSLTFITDFFKTRFGLIYKEPALAQVSNVFYLPFAADVWFSVLASIIVFGTILYFQLRTLEKYNRDDVVMSGKDVFTFFTGAAFQQGSDIVSNTISARTTMGVFLFASLFIFTSYTANIVALLQSTSDSVHNIHDLIDSTFDLGFEDQPYQRSLLENDTNPAIKDLFNRKMFKKIADGTGYVNATLGLNMVHEQLFAFHVELSTAGRIIRNTYEEDEKCRLKMLPLFPYRYNGLAVPKRSPFREILAQAYRWYQEVGFAQRADIRFGSDLPRCWSRGGGGFSSIGLTEVSFIIKLMIYGLALSIILLLSERIYFICEKRSRVEHLHDDQTVVFAASS